MPRRRKEIIEIKEFIKPSRLLPIHNDDYTELIFFLCSCTQKVVRFKDFYVSNHGQDSQNYERYHFITDGKELNDDEIDKFEKKFTLDDYTKENFDIFNKNNYIKICSDFPINPAFNNPEL